MKTRLLAFPLLVLGAVVLAGACTVSGGLGVGIGTCAADGDACAFDSDCCGDVCAVDQAGNGVCSTPAGCIEDNDGPCDDDSQCCSGICASDGNCGLPACAADQSACNGDADCCDAEFCDETAGLTCQTCLGTGAACNADGDCCSFSCDVSGTCN